MSDNISRQEALDACAVSYYASSAYKRIESLPSTDPKEVYCPMASRTCFSNGKEVAWCLTCPHISEEDRDLVKKAIAEPKTGECKTCKRSSDYRWSIGENGTRCPIEEHYALPKDGYCHLYEPYREDGEA